MTISQRQQAIDLYHDLCTTGTLAQDTWDTLLPGLSAHGPRLRRRTPDDRAPPALALWDRLALSTLAQHGCARRLSQAGGSAPRRPCPPPPGAPHARRRTLIQIPTGFDTILPTPRLDSFLTVNADGSSTPAQLRRTQRRRPGGFMAYSDVLSDLFLETPLMQAFGAHYRVEPVAVGAIQRGECAAAHLLPVARRSRQAAQHRHRGLGGRADDDKSCHLFVDYFARYEASPSRSAIRRRWSSATACSTLARHRGLRLRVLTTELLQRYQLQRPIIRPRYAPAPSAWQTPSPVSSCAKASFAVV